VETDRLTALSFPKGEREKGGGIPEKRVASSFVLLHAKNEVWRISKMYSQSDLEDTVF